MTDDQLHKTAIDIDRIDQAGWLADLEHDMAEWREPFIDPMHGVRVKRIARAMSRILGISPRQTEQAAKQALLPTRQQHAIALIAWYAGQLADQQTAEATDGKLAKARRRGR